MMIVNLTDVALRQLISEAIAAEGEAKREMNDARSRAATAEREQYVIGKHVACFGALKEILQSEMARREARQ